MSYGTWMRQTLLHINLEFCPRNLMRWLSPRSRTLVGEAHGAHMLPQQGALPCCNLDAARIQHTHMWRPWNICGCLGWPRALSMQVFKKHPWDVRMLCLMSFLEGQGQS